MVDYPALLLICVVVVFGIAITVVLLGLASKFPKCGAWFAMKVASRQEVGQERDTKWTTTTTTATDGSGETCQTQTSEMVNIVRHRYDGIFRCQKCGFEQRKEFTEEQEL